MFEKAYILLVHYSLIQFRNYQASNFNIINLLFACYIVQKYLCKKFARSLQQISKIALHNHLKLDKTDEIELFFGKVGSNKVLDCDKGVLVYSYWMTEVLKLSNSFHSRFYEENNLLKFTQQSYDQISSIKPDLVQQKKDLEEMASMQVIKYNVNYLTEILPIINIVRSLQEGDIKTCLSEIKLIS